MRNKKIKGIKNNRGKESISDTICCQLMTMSTKTNLLMQVNSDKMESMGRKRNQDNPFQHHRHNSPNIFFFRFWRQNHRRNIFEVQFVEECCSQRHVGQKELHSLEIYTSFSYFFQLEHVSILFIIYTQQIFEVIYLESLAYILHVISFVHKLLINYSIVRRVIVFLLFTFSESSWQEHKKWVCAELLFEKPFVA